ncbi:MAG TPA: hypothetical protein VHS34_03685 [Terriglobales bacterium]|jgi:hypothetical protein|nr:hypothetical protein [Terriglobales bacterium]
MKPAARILLSSLLGLVLAVYGQAQCSGDSAGCVPRVPRLVKYSGTLKDAAGNPLTGVVGITFSVYADSTGGVPLWQEVQNVQLDQQGRYAVLLGTSTSGGIPVELFSSGESRYLGVQPSLSGETERPRVLMVSVPYALKAGDAETLGGLPPSAFLRAAPSIAGQNTADSNNPKSQAVVAIGGSPGAPAPRDAGVTAPGGTPDTVPKFATGSSIVDSQITDSNGVVSVQNLANILFADRFANGVPDAIAACPANGCIIYAGSSTVNLNLGTIDPGSKTITIYLGPYAYNIKQITLRRSLRIIGMGASSGPTGAGSCTVSAPCSGTSLQSVNGNNPVVVLPQANNSPATNVVLSGFRLLGSAGNTSEDGIFLDTSSLANSGLWFSTFSGLEIEGFAGVGVHLKGPNNNFGAISQWLHFSDVIVFRTAGGGNGLRMEGANFEMDFSNCQFDGQAIGDGTNMYIGGLPGGVDGYPLNIRFTGLVTQAAAVGVQIDGASGVSFYSSHHEKLWGVFSITNNTGIGTKGVTIADANFFGVGVNNGAGYLLNVSTTLAFGINFLHNQVLGSPDAVVLATNAAQIVYRDNYYFDHRVFNVPPTSGITTQLSPAATLDIGGAHTVGLSPSTTPITTIQSSLGPGEMVTFFTVSGSVTFNSGGNINLGGAPSVTVSGSITFVRNDLSGPTQAWTPVAQWSSGITNPAEFTVSASPTTATIHAGESSDFNLSVTPSDGFSGAVQLTCTGAPPKSTCSISPNPLMVSGTSAVSATIMLETTAAHELHSNRGEVALRTSLPGFGSLAAGLILGVMPFSEKTRSKRGKQWGLLGCLLLLLGLCAGCGSTMSAPPPMVSGTPQGIYLLRITGTSGGANQSATITLTVQ